MPSTFEQLNPTRVKLTVDIPFSELEPAVEKTYKEISQQVNIPGFRKGKVPARLIDQRFGRGVVLQEALNTIMPQVYSQALEEHDLRPLSQPEIEVTELNDGENVVFTAELDICPPFELPDPESISVEISSNEVTEEDVDSRIEMLRERFASLTEVERAAADGDVVNINMVASQDGSALDEAQADDVQYQIGSGEMLDGLDEAVTGLSAGEKATFSSTLLGGPHAGKEADIEVEVIKVNEKDLPELDDEFAQLVSEFDTVEEMRADLRDGVERSARLDQIAQARSKVIEYLVDNTEFELPQQLIDTEKEAERENIEYQLSMAGLTLDAYLAQEDTEYETAEEFWAAAEEESEKRIRSQLIMDQLANQSEVEVTQQELTQAIFARAQQMGVSPEQELQNMMQQGHAAELMGDIRRGKALGQLVSKVKVVDQDGNELDLSAIKEDGTLAADDESASAEQAEADSEE